MCVVQVMDEGPGIPPADLEHVFDKFYRVGGADRRRAGTGLGLAICRGFVEAMHGTIDGGQSHRPFRCGVHHHAAGSAEAERPTETIE